MQVMEVELTKAIFVAARPSKVTVNPDPETKFVPVRVTEVPPAVGPVAGETVVIVGAGAVSE